MCKKQGFTLVEMLFVVLIAAGVIAFAVPAYKKARERSDYNAALGTLLDMNNAVNSLKRDLEMSTGKSLSFPTTVSYMKYGGSNWTSAKPNPYDVAKSWNENVASQTDANFEKAFLWALTEFKYLKNMQKTKGYDFYILNPQSNSTVSGCGGLADGKKGTACMLKNNTTAGCYKGAVVLPDGSITRVKGDNCKN